MMDNKTYDPESLPDLLPIYYKHIFPSGPYCKWLQYGGVPKSYFSNREFSFTLKDDIYIRYQSFSDQQELEKELINKCPYKIDIGAVYTHRPKDHKTIKSTSFQAQEKELVFDIDMTDYDDVRSCCSGADICAKCWPLMVIAVKILDRALRDDFGFKHILWIYSGRRGIHAWVCDENARKLSPTGRSAVAEYLTLVRGGDSQTRKAPLPENKLHPSIRHALQVINTHFYRYLIHDQDFLGSEEKWNKVVAIVPSENVRGYLSSDFKRKEFDDTAKRWGVLKKRIKEGREKNMIKLPRLVEEIQLQYCYPRLDINVSKGINHLLKSPFCVHPKTGKVCVPMDPKKMESFDPENVPTISGLIDEIDKVQLGEKDEQGKRQKVYRKTSLGPYMDIFDQFLKALEESRKGSTIAESDIKMEF